jgi:hypothetical protein
MKNSLWPMLVAEKVFVSMMSAPASRKRRWMSPIIVGLRELNEVAVVLADPSAASLKPFAADVLLSVMS